MTKRTITAGTEEKGDAQITVTPLSSGREIEILKIPHPRFRDAVEKTVNRILDEEGAENLRVEVSDFGALEFVIEARVRAALRLAAGGEPAC